MRQSSGWLNNLDQIQPTLKHGNQIALCRKFTVMMTLNYSFLSIALDMING